jgi:hypothetical protein
MHKDEINERLCGREQVSQPKRTLRRGFGVIMVSREPGITLEEGCCLTDVVIRSLFVSASRLLRRGGVESFRER